jgi:pimeloyl-ACP methyl ester carboxylesterase
MSGDHHTSHLVHGTAAGDQYVALPPTAVDATATGPTRLILAWPGFDPPRTAGALAAAIPMTGVPVWRVYLDLPAASSGGLGSGSILETETIETYCAAVENAVRRLPEALADIRRDLQLPDGPVALAGFSAGAAAAMLAAARDAAPVTALALIAPVVAPSRVARAVEKRSGLDRAWTPDATALAERLDLGALAADLAGRDMATLLISGSKDRVVPAREITSLRDLLRRHDTGSVQATTFRMGHALAAEPGTEARPPITEAVRVDGALTDWFRDRLAQPAPVPAETAMDADGAWSSDVSSGDVDATPSTADPDAQARTDSGDAHPAGMVHCPPDGEDELVDQGRDSTW